ncbi:LysR family transcriptional regulator [Chromobacterium haemolyticum]|uniref:LysR family transcriptional regulator n=1 Tax=Chromobacterium haemolyticum TaxID=394935 RepID=UPI002447F565|nr:LysR family transcriptional regulator [Chromobacterium haemolyticum]MDH0340878.1 LysR family transcriptional regulator [Chromobacterium haemolyticum]
MELRHLRYFIAVAEHQSVRLASERLHITQPAVSRQIQDLEQELGLPLFERAPRGLKLTAAGASYLRDVRKAMAVLDDAAEGARRVAAGLLGRLRLGCVENAGWDGLVPQAFSRFQAEAPEVALELSVLNTPRQLGALAEGALDGGFIYQYEPLPEGVAGIPLLEHDVVLALPRCWDTGHDENLPVALSSLADRPFVMLPREAYPGYYDRLIGACQQQGVHLKVAQEAGTETAILSLVCAGIGAAIVNSANLGRPPAQARFFRLRDLSLSMPLTFVSRLDAGNPALARFLTTLQGV